MSLNIEIYKTKNDALCDLIDSYWHIHGRDFDGPLFNIPDGHQEIFFNLQTKKIQINISRPGPELLATEKSVNVFIIRFTPYGLSLLLKRVNSNDTFKNDDLINRLSNIVFSGKAITIKINNIERTFMHKYSKEVVPDFITKDIVLKLIQARGNERLSSLYSGYSLSSRQIETNFRIQTTITPKTFARIVRLNNIILIKQQNPSLELTNLSYEYGYTDQSHFIKDFKKFLSVTPHQFFSKRKDTQINYYSI